MVSRGDIGNSQRLKGAVGHGYVGDIVNLTS